MAANGAPDALRNRLLRRDVNDRVVELTPAHLDGEIGVLCECVERDCVELLRIRRDRYDAVRAHPMRFVVKPDHAARSDDAVVGSEDGGRRSSPTG